MYISRNWLKQFVPIPDSLSAKEFGLNMTIHSVEVEEVIEEGKNFKNIVVGKVVSERPHPGADKLKLYDVDLGTETVQIVCGGSNVKVDMLTAVAKVGAQVRWHGQGDLVTLESTKIRGETSEGMICQSTEIGLGDLMPIKDEAEIMDLSALDLKPGQALAEALELNDVLYEVDNKTITHRPDLWGHYGMARDVSAWLNLPLNDYAVADIEPGTEKELKITVDDPELCLRFAAVIIDGIVIKESPLWLKKRLQSIGVRSINTIVDVTNYVMYELGQPMHAYDYDQIKTDELIIRRANDKEPFKSLDDKEHKLDTNDIVVASPNEVLGLAGIMGGAKSEVSEATTRIVLEAGVFEPVITRRSSVKHGLRSDASLRQEKNLDPVMITFAMSRAVELIKELNPGARVISNLVDVTNKEYEVTPIKVNMDWLSKRAGVEFKDEEIIDVLGRLGFGVEVDYRDLTINVPSWRATKDINLPEDILEEVSRVYGYDNIEIKLPVVAIEPPRENYERKLERRIKTILTGLGSTETYNHTFLSKTQLDQLELDVEKHIKLLNPVSEEHEYVRRELFPNLLKNLVDNYNQTDKLNWFEIGRVFVKEGQGEAADPQATKFLPKQDKSIAIIYYQKDEQQPFNALKGIVDELWRKLFLKVDLQVVDEAFSWAHPERSVWMSAGKTSLGYITEVHPFISQRLGIPGRVAIAEFSLNVLVDLVDQDHEFVDIVKFPTINYDLAFVMDKTVIWDDIKVVINKAGQGLVKDIEVFDVYEGDKIEAGKKSVAFHLIYQAKDKTLTSDEIKPIHAAVIKAIETEFKAKLRA